MRFIRYNDILKMYEKIAPILMKYEQHIAYANIRITDEVWTQLPTRTTVTNSQFHLIFFTQKSARCKQTLQTHTLINISCQDYVQISICVNW